MNIQIYGVKKCFDTRKAERYFKERRIKFQTIDLLRFGLSKGELNNVKAAVGLNKLINQNAKSYKELNLHQVSGAGLREEILLTNPSLYNTPIVRNGRKATVGFQPEIWDEWINLVD